MKQIIKVLIFVLFMLGFYFYGYNQREVSDADKFKNFETKIQKLERVVKMKSQELDSLKRKLQTDKNYRSSTTSKAKSKLVKLNRYKT